MAALVQTYPQQTGTVTMLQTRPSSNSGMASSGQSQSSHQYMASPQAPRSAYHASGSPASYRGTSAPIQPYAFTSTPNQGMPWTQQPNNYWINSSPVAPVNPTYDANMSYRGRFPSNPPVLTLPSMPSMGLSSTGSWDDSAINTQRNVSSPSRAMFSSSMQAGARASPDRYRRPQQLASHHARSQSSSLPLTPPVGNANNLYNGPNTSRAAVPTRPNSFYGSGPGLSFDDTYLQRPSSQDDQKRMRRRSMITLDTNVTATPSQEKTKTGDASDRARLGAPASIHSRTGSAESVSSTKSGHSRPSSATNRNVSTPTGNPSSLPIDETSGKHDQPKLISIPARGSSTDAAKRTLNPSPLSKPATMAADTTEESSSRAGSSAGPTAAGSANLETPAAKHLAAISQKGGRGKNKTSRLRRAFSFGSAAEFRQAAEPAQPEQDKTQPSKLHKDPTPDEAYDAEQARIAEAQEAAGIGNSIYGSRFNFGSTDNLSISSTASSASIMIRKMGRGAKKSARSLAGLFRPKSIIGVPASDALAPEASQAEVSMITVEAETQRVNVNPDPPGPNGGTGFPHLERNSLDASQVPEMAAASEPLGNSANDGGDNRKSIVGGDRERAEVLAAVRKGILKRAGSPSSRAADASPDLVLPNAPAIADSPMSSAPSTPNDDVQGHRRTGSVAIGTEDYFVNALRLRPESRSMPGTPQAGGKRNATFSPRIIFYDTWPSQEYDRRGEIATCNRLTPMLAQQIKEELNTFKMEMEVHENSKIYTHFF